ncbi:MAG: hypothetical protein O6952_00275, partial [Planctomycetota bacterium]|nr:hypothetical protein [Planctomycetota bacterium]
MRTKPFLAGIFLATLAMIPILIFTRKAPEETKTDGSSSDTPVDPSLQDEGIWTEPTGSNGDQETPSAELIAGMGAKQIALALRVVVLQGGDPAELLLAAGDEEAEAIRAYLALIRDENDLRLFAKLTQSLGSLSDPEGDILSYCQKELVADDRPIMKLILAEILEGRPDEASIGPLRQVLDQYWDSENPDEGRGVMRSALQSLGKIDSEAARQEIWRRFRAAP